MASYDGHVWVLICIIAFGMGVDAKGVHTVIRFGPSSNLESYVQESGRCSRDGQPGSCVILYQGRMLSSCAQDIRSYVSSGTCCREQINSYLTFCSFYSFLLSVYALYILGHYLRDPPRISNPLGQNSLNMYKIVVVQFLVVSTGRNQIFVLNIHNVLHWFVIREMIDPMDVGVLIV